MPAAGSKRSAAAGGQAQASDGLVVLHRSRFIEWQPAPIVALASSHDGSLAAAVRETGDVELYDTSSWHCFQVGRRWQGMHAAARCRRAGGQAAPWWQPRQQAARVRALGD